MSKKDAKDTRWKSEIAREERKTRLESLKSGDGGKKPIKTRSIKGALSGLSLYSSSLLDLSVGIS